MNENLCDEKVMELQGKIMVIEEEIKTLSVQIGGTHDSEEKKLLLKREILLREEKIQLIELGNRLIERESARLKSRPQQQAGDLGPSQARGFGPSRPIVTYDAYIGTCASGFVASGLKVPVNCAVNGMCMESFNVPAIVKEAINHDVPTNTLTDAESAIRAGFLFTMYPVNVHERGVPGEKRTVTGTAGVALKQFFEDKAEHLSSHFTVELSSMWANIGPASDGSKPDVVCTVATGRYKQVGLLVCELKDTAFSPLEKLGQAFVSASNLLITQSQIGLSPSEVAIPLILSTGNLMQFAWVTTLDPLFPVLNVTSRMFDISVADDVREASKALARAKIFCRKQAGLLRRCRERDEILPMVPSLNSDLYHLKSIQCIFNRYDDDDLIGDVGLAYLWKVFEALKDVDEAVKPLGYATTMKNKVSEKCLIFPKLDASFRMGVPEAEKQFKEYITAFLNVIKRQHQRQVVHVDLYPSNVLWDLLGDSNRNRIVNWDTATFFGYAM